MTFAVTDVTGSTANLSIDGDIRARFKADRTIEGVVVPPMNASDKTLATMGNLREYGGLPRFTPYISAARADAIAAEGDIQSSGQQTLDLMFPTMRADVIASQYHCTESEWQADPYKRATHWSLGDGVSWMRPPDRNGVQPGNVGAFYGAGSNPADTKTGTAVIDAMRNIVGSLDGVAMTSQPTSTSGALKVIERLTNVTPPSIGTSWGRGNIGVDASLSLPPGTTTDPITGEFRPRTWYGIWMIRMYGRVLNPGALDAAGLNARMDMIDARVSTLEGRHKALGDGQTWKNMLASRAFSVNYTNNTGRAIWVVVAANATVTGSSGLTLSVDGNRVDHSSTSSTGLGVSVGGLVPNGSVYSVTTANVSAAVTWLELRV